MPGTDSSFAEHLADTRLRDCFDFWLTSRQGGQLPQKRAINATRLPPTILPNLFLYELTTESRFKCRLAGTSIRHAFGRDPTGLLLDEMVHPASARDRIALFRATLEKKVPVVYGGKLAEGQNLWMLFKRLLLPVMDEHGSSRFVFGMVIFPHVDSSRQHAGQDLPVEFEAWATPADLTVELDPSHSPTEAEAGSHRV
jgi:hypothetical protein